MLSGVLITEEIDGVGNTGAGDCTVVDVKALGRLFRHVHKTAKNDYYFHHVSLSVSASIHTEQLLSHWMDFREICYLRIFQMSVEKIQVPLKSDKNNGCVMCRPIYIFYHISPIFS
jgi:hypothetical protein